MKQDVFKDAKAIDLDLFLGTVLNVKPIRVSGWLRYSSCPKCGTSSTHSVKCSTRNGYFRCWSCLQSGDIIKAAAHFYGFGQDFLSAAKLLLEEFGGGSFVANYESASREQLDEEDNRRYAAAERIISSLRGIDFGSNLPPATMHYLTVTRALPREIVKEAIRKGMIVGLPTQPNAIRTLLEKRFSSEDLQTSKFWKEPGKKLPGIAYRPLMFPLPGGKSAEFRVIREDNLKEGTAKAIRYGKTTQPWRWEGTDPLAPVYIVEGILDMLSIPALGLKGDVIGLPGAGSWADCAQEWFGHLVGRRVVVCLDNDPGKKPPIENPGQYWAKRLCDALLQLGVHDVENKLMTVGIDPNKVLQNRARRNAASHAA